MLKEPSSSNLRVPHKGDCSDADSGYDDPGVISIPVVRTVVRKDSDGRKSSTTSTEWVSFKKKDSTSQNPQSHGPFETGVGGIHSHIGDDAKVSRFCKETKNESDQNKRYHFIGKSRMGRGPLMPTIRDVTISNSVHLQEETTKRSPRRRIRSKSADSRGSQNLFSPTYSKILSPETMRKRRALAEILKRDNILEEEYYKLPYEDINREIILGHRLSISETRLNILKGFERRPKADRDVDISETETFSVINKRLNSSKSHMNRSGAECYETSPDSKNNDKPLLSTNTATNNLKDLIADLISGSNLGANFSLTLSRPEITEESDKSQPLQSPRVKPVPKPRNSLKNKRPERDHGSPSLFCEDSVLSNLDKEFIDINKNYSPTTLRNENFDGILQLSPDIRKERLVPMNIVRSYNCPEFKSPPPPSEIRKLTKHELLNRKIDDYLEKSALKPTFSQNENMEAVPPLSYSSGSERLFDEDHTSIFTNLRESVLSDGTTVEIPRIKPRAKSSNSSDEGIVNISYSSHGSIGNSKDDLTNDDNSPKFSNLKRGRKKLKKKVSFSTESDEMFYPSTDSDSCAFDDGSPIDPDSGSESCLDDQELVVVRSFEVEGPFSVNKPVIHYLEGDDQTTVQNGVVVDDSFRVYRPIIQYAVGVEQTVTPNDIVADIQDQTNTKDAQFRKAVDQTTLENNNNVLTVVDKQLQALEIGKGNEDCISNRVPINFETNILPAEDYFNSYLNNTKSTSSLPEEKVNDYNKKKSKTVNDGNYKQSYRNKNNRDSSSIPRNEKAQNSRLSPQQLYYRDPYTESFHAKKTDSLSSPFKGDYVNIHLSKGLDFTQHEIYLRTQMRTQKPVVTVTRMKVPFSSIRDQWDWASPLMLQHRRTFEALARDFRNDRNSGKQDTYEQIVPITYSPEGETSVATSSCGSPTFSGSSSGCYSAPCSPSPSSPRNRAATLPTPL